MSSAYHLACVDCAEAILLGKVVQMDESGRAVDPHFAGWSDEPAYREHAAGFARILMRFMIHHRCHELRVLPENLIDEVDPEGILLSHLDDDEVRLRPLSSDPADDFDGVPCPEAVRRLEERFSTTDAP
jgi:hypothetical protein